MRIQKPIAANPAVQSMPTGEPAATQDNSLTPRPGLTRPKAVRALRALRRRTGQV